MRKIVQRSIYITRNKKNKAHKLLILKIKKIKILQVKQVGKGFAAVGLSQLN
jgi:hypothetical protein